MTIPTKCPACGGDGYIERDVSHGDYIQCEAWTCPGCAGKGRLWTREDGEPQCDDTLVEFEGIVDSWENLDEDDRALFLNGPQELVTDLPHDGEAA